MSLVTMPIAASRPATWSKVLLSGSMGTLELLCGPMFSGKTDELIRRFHAAHADGRKALMIKPAVDTRHPTGLVVSHSGAAAPATAVASSGDVLQEAAEVDALFVDEVQFFDPE